MARRRTRITLLSAAVAIAAYINITDPFVNEPPATRVGTAGVVLGDATARIVERVSYRQDVERVGDVIVVDGVPRDAIEGEIAAVWRIVDELWPVAYRDRLAQVSVVREQPRGLVGVVHPSSLDGWILSLDVADLDDPALLRETIIHELSHVVTLDDDVFVFGVVDGCPGVQIALGCAAPSTVLADFAAEFWPNGPVDDAAAFVNDYASTAAHEDLAETFTAWVLDWPVTGETARAKVAWLQADDELRRLGEDLRTRLAVAATAAG